MSITTAAFPKKQFALTVAKVARGSLRPILVVQIPWDQFGAPGGPEAYARIIEEKDAIAVIVAKSPLGEWASSTKFRDDWEVVNGKNPLDALEWHTMAAVADEYPWESFGRSR